MPWDFEKYRDALRFILIEEIMRVARRREEEKWPGPIYAESQHGKASADRDWRAFTASERLPTLESIFNLANFIDENPSAIFGKAEVLYRKGPIPDPSTIAPKQDKSPGRSRKKKTQNS